MDECHFIFLHGLAKKPPPDQLDRIWLDSLGISNPKPEIFGYANPGIDLDAYVGHTLTYWADVFHNEYETDLASYSESANSQRTYESVAYDGGGHDATPLPEPTNEAERRFLEAIIASTGLGKTMTDSYVAPQDDADNVVAGTMEYSLERVPLPLGLKKVIIRKFASEAFYYLFDKNFTRADGKIFAPRTEIRRRVIGDLTAARASAKRVVIVSHSMGTIIAYDCLRNCPDCPPVDGLITLGTPLGIDEVQDQLKPADAASVDFPSARLIGEWVNVYDKLDVVCAADPRLSNDFLKNGIEAISDVNEQNWGDWRHNISHYLKGPKLRAAIRKLGRF